MHPRTDWERTGWTVAEHTNSGPVDWTRVRGVTIHYTAATTTPAGGQAVADYLAQIQHDYAANRGYSIGYNWAVDRTGDKWELRGQDYRCAANGTTQYNTERVAILCLVNGTDRANADMIQSVRDIVAVCNILAGRTLIVDGHRDVRATGCPGAGLYAQVQSGDFLPRTEPDPPPPPPPSTIEGLPMFITQHTDGTYHVGLFPLFRTYVADPAAVIAAYVAAGSPLVDLTSRRPVLALADVTRGNANALGTPVATMVETDGMAEKVDRINARVDGLHRKVDALETPASQDLTIRLTGTASADTA